MLNCYYAHADQADQLQASPGLLTRSVTSLLIWAHATPHSIYDLACLCTLCAATTSKGGAWQRHPIACSHQTCLATSKPLWDRVQYAAPILPHTVANTG